LQKAAVSFASKLEGYSVKMLLQVVEFTMTGHDAQEKTDMNCTESKA